MYVILHVFSGANVSYLASDHFSYGPQPCTRPVFYRSFSVSCEVQIRSVQISKSFGLQTVTTDHLCTRAYSSKSCTWCKCNVFIEILIKTTWIAIVFEPRDTRVRMMLGVPSIVPNTNIDSNDLHDCLK